MIGLGIHAPCVLTCVLPPLIFMPRASFSDRAMSLRRAINLDRLGLGLSGLCIVHCLALPVGLALLPLWPVAAQIHIWLHAVFAVVIVPTTLAAMWYGYRRHGSYGTLSLLGLGLITVLAALLIGHEAPGEVTETLVTLSGSSLLILGHWRNWSFTGSCGLHGLSDQEGQ